MTLVESPERIATGVQRASQRDIVTDRVAQLKRVESNLDQLIPVVDEAMRLVRAASSSGISLPTDVLVSLRDRITHAALQANNGKVDTSELGELVIDVRTEAASVKSTVAISWRDVVDRRIPQREGLKGLADTYLQLDPGNSLARQLKDAVGLAQELTRVTPSNDALQRLDQVADQIPQLLRDLVGDDPSVRFFAERVARGGASLQSVTQEVQQWIAAKGFEGSFKIVPGEPES